ncbi:MAG: ABC transporter substrate-binding protein [Chloroflexi bacterium]|nr:ABC transporter substrate-binding protein [Chloroflexota bacterium]
MFGKKHSIRVARLVGAVAAMVAVTGTAVAQDGGYIPPHDRPGPASDSLLFRAFNVDLAPQELARGSMDLYIFNLKTEAARALRANDDVMLFEAPASTISLVLNPAPAPEGELNPFSIPEVRRAMQHLVNRDFIAQEIYKGQGRPMYTHVSPFDYDYTILAEMLAEADLDYDPARGRASIATAMQAAGVEMIGGFWSFDGQPIRIKFIVRVEDERREVGDVIRTELAAAGFQVAPVYHQFGPAIQTVYGTDPQQFDWHLYTEGWGRGSAERYDYATVNQMAAPWLGNMPGWQENGYWQYENAALDDVGQRIFRGDFSDQAARDELYQEATKLALDDSVRIWLTTVVNTFPAKRGILGVSEDVVAGPKAQWTLREAYLPGSTSLTVGNLWVWTERSTWNPIGGLGDLYSVDIWRNLYDAPMARHPFSGLPIPFRAEYDVTTAGPSGQLDVPTDAVRWHAANGTWASVGSGVRATSKVTFDYRKYFQSTWHHGQPITMADVAYGIYQSFDMTYSSEKSQVEFALAVTARPLLDTVKGYRFLDENRVEVYVDYWHFVDDYIAEYAVPTGLSMPWEVMAAMDDLVFAQRRAAYSDTAAARFSVPWLSLVQSRDARLVDRTLRTFAEAGQIPSAAMTIGGKSLVSAAEAQARYKAARDWFAERDMLVISNGPYRLVRFDPPAQFAELEAFREENYPFKPGDWYFGPAPRLQITPGPEPTIEIGQPARIAVTVEGPGNVGAQFFFADSSSGRLIKSGFAEAGSTGSGEFSVAFSGDETGALTPGLYQLTLTAFSDGLSTVAERTMIIEAIPAGSAQPAPTPTQVGGAAVPTPQSATPPGGSESSGGCGLGGSTADIGLIAAVMMVGLVGTARAGRRRRTK